MENRVCIATSNSTEMTTITMTMTSDAVSRFAGINQECALWFAKMEASQVYNIISRINVSRQSIVFIINVLQIYQT